MAVDRQVLRSDLELCPSCGDFAELNAITGWCLECTGGDYCQRCGRPFANDSYRRYCSTCRVDQWLEDNADEIEDCLEAGFSVKEAINQVKAKNKTRCISCLDVLQGPGLLCHKPKCRKVYNRYRVRRAKGYTQERAIREALVA